MREGILDRMRTRAFVVVGRPSWDRAKNDPVVESSLYDAQKFLKSVDSRISIPQITGGTSANPRDVIVLYWLIEHVDQIVGIYVHFHGFDDCHINIVDVDGSEVKIDDLSVDDLLLLDIPGKFEELRDKIAIPEARFWP